MLEIKTRKKELETRDENENGTKVKINHEMARNYLDLITLRCDFSNFF